MFKDLAIVIIILAAGIVIGAILDKWAKKEIPAEENESPFFAAENYPAVKVHRVGKHRRSDSFPISNVVEVPDTQMSPSDEQDLEDTLGFFAAVRAETEPAPSDETEIISTVTEPIPQRTAITALLG